MSHGSSGHSVVDTERRGHAFCLWRSFSNPILWQALLDCGAGTPAKEPDWKNLETVLRHFTENGLPVGGGIFRATTLKNTVCTLAPNGDRHLPRTQPARHSRAAWRGELCQSNRSELTHKTLLGTPSENPCVRFAALSAVPRVSLTVSTPTTTSK